MPIKPNHIIPLTETRKVLHRVSVSRRTFILVYGWPKQTMPRGVHLDDRGTQWGKTFAVPRPSRARQI